MSFDTDLSFSAEEIQRQNEVLKIIDECNTYKHIEVTPDVFPTSRRIGSIMTNGMPNMGMGFDDRDQTRLARLCQSEDFRRLAWQAVKNNPTPMDNNMVFRQATDETFLDIPVEDFMVGLNIHSIARNRKDGLVVVTQMIRDSINERERTLVQQTAFGLCKIDNPDIFLSLTYWDDWQTAVQGGVFIDGETRYISRKNWFKAYGTPPPYQVATVSSGLLMDPDLREPLIEILMECYEGANKYRCFNVETIDDPGRRVVLQRGETYLKSLHDSKEKAVKEREAKKEAPEEETVTRRTSRV